MLAAVDVGTNTVRLLIGEVEAGALCPGFHYRKITRLGGSASEAEGLAPEAMERTLFALREIASLVEDAGVSKVRAVGTAALRRACNGAEFVERVRSETGLPLEVIGGEEEARLSALGVMAALDPRPGRCIVFDIGGGSTEFVLLEGERVLFQRSYPLGAVDLCENFSREEDQARRIGELLARFAADLSASSLSAEDFVPVGTAGTVTTLAAFNLSMVEYDWRRINNAVLTLAELSKMLHRLAPLSPREREALPGIEEGRGDLIVPGLRITLAILELLGRNRLLVSDFGLLEGALLSMEDGVRCPK